MVEQFKKIKRNLKASLNDTQSLISQGLKSQFSARKEYLEQARLKLSQCDRLLKDLDGQWNHLSMREKYHYNGKVQSFRQQYESHRVNFFKLEDDELTLSMGAHELNKLKGNISHSNAMLRNQDQVLQNVKTLGIQAHQNMQQTGVGLRDQGHLLMLATQKNQAMTANLK